MLSTNTKLKKDGIYSFNLPAVQTCPFAGDCKKFCYAKKGNFVYPVVIDKAIRNFNASKAKNFDIKIAVEAEIRNIKIIRVHSSGDFYNRRYASRWIKIAKDNPNLIIYAYTKSWEFFPSRLPKNMILIESVGGKKPIHTNKPHARIFKTAGELKKAGYIDCSKSDLKAIRAIQAGKKKIGLIYH